MAKRKSKIENIMVSYDYRNDETLEERDHRICEEDGEPYEPSELTDIVMQYVEGTKVKTDVESLTALSKDLDEWNGYKLIIEPNGMLSIYIT